MFNITDAASEGVLYCNNQPKCESCNLPVAPRFLIFILFIFLSTAAFSQQSFPLPSETRPELPEFVEERPEDTVQHPETAPVKKQPAITTPLARIFIRKIILSGNHAIPDEELRPLVEPYENRKINSIELEELRQKLTLHYINKGFINSGAIITNQTIVDNSIEIRIIEGILTQTSIIENERLRESYLLPRLSTEPGKPLNINNIQENIHILLQNPAIESINAQLQPGDRPGEAILVAKINEKKPYYGQVVFNNDVPPSVGDNKLEFRFGHNNLTGWSDTLHIQLAKARELKEYALEYEIPINSKDTKLLLHFNRTSSKVIEEPFDILDIKSKSHGFGLKISHPFFKTRHKQFLMTAGLEWKHSESSLLGLPFSFSLGANDGISKAAIVRISQEWLSREQDTVLAARSVFSIGTDMFGATDNDTAPGKEYVSWLGQLQWAHRLNSEINSQVIFRTDIQVSTEPLLTFEKFSVGGVNSVRGYRRNQLVRDEGFTSSIEYRRDFIDLSQRRLGKIQIAPFFDIGGAWNINRDNPSPTVLSGIGVGLLWKVHDRIQANLTVSRPLREVDNPSHDLQDDSIYFQLAADIF